MADDPDIVRAAKLLIGKYGDQAHVAAAKRASDLIKDGQRGAAAIWLRMAVRAEELLRDVQERS